MQSSIADILTMWPASERPPSKTPHHSRPRGRDSHSTPDASTLALLTDALAFSTHSPPTK